MFVLSGFAGIPGARYETRPLVIVPVGDSITQGGRTDREEYTYRLPLQRLLHEAGVAYDFVGSRREGLHVDAKWPMVAPGVPFDPDHEGHYGAKTSVVCARFLEALGGYPAAPDFALVHLGTNDQDGTDLVADYVAPLREIVVGLRARNPRIVALIGHLHFDGDRARTMRRLAEELVSELDRPESPVRTVHHYRGFQPDPARPNADTFDWAHPNQSGQEKMARAWFEAMRSWFSHPFAVGTSVPGGRC